MKTCFVRRRTEDWFSLADEDYFRPANLVDKIGAELTEGFMPYVLRWWNLFRMPLTEFRGGLAQISDENIARCVFDDRQRHSDLTQYDPETVYVPCDDDDWLRGMSYLQDTEAQCWGVLRLSQGGDPAFETIPEDHFLPTNSYALRGDALNKACASIGRKAARDLLNKHETTRWKCRELGFSPPRRTAGATGVHVLTIASTTHASWRPLTDEEILVRVRAGVVSTRLEGFEPECDRLAELYRQLNDSVKVRHT